MDTKRRTTSLLASRFNMMNMRNLLLIALAGSTDAFAFAPCRRLVANRQNVRLSALSDSLDVSQASSSFSQLNALSESVDVVGSPSLSGVLPIVIAVAAVVIFGFAASALKPAIASNDAQSDNLNGAKEIIIEKPDLSIPYDAAAMLAYREMKGLSDSQTIDMDEYSRFKPAYESAAVAGVMARRKLREFQDAESIAKTKADEMRSLVVSVIEETINEEEPSMAA